MTSPNDCIGCEWPVDYDCFVSSSTFENVTAGTREGLNIWAAFVQNSLTGKPTCYLFSSFSQHKFSSIGEQLWNFFELTPLPLKLTKVL